MSGEEKTSLSKILVAITGASGIRYGLSTLKHLSRLVGRNNVDAILTEHALLVAKYEEKLDLHAEAEKYASHVYYDDEMTAPYASSSSAAKAMVIVPCSVKTLALIAGGIASTLTARAALAALRLKRKLVLVIRETPLGVIELENMLKVARAGAIIMPASPGFYHNPRTIDDLVDFIVGKILDVLEIEHNLYTRWGEPRTLRLHNSHVSS